MTLWDVGRVGSNPKASVVDKMGVRLKNSTFKINGDLLIGPEY